jgi:hypothetical protein
MQVEARMRRRSPWVRAVAVVSVLALLGGALAVWPFLFPTSDAPFDDGPIVALGGDPSRPATAIALATTSTADPDPVSAAASGTDRPLVFSATAIGEARRDHGLACDPPAVSCLHPHPVNTYGEAIGVADLIEVHGWDRVTVVTSPHHVTRSRLLFERCVDVPVRVVASDQPARAPLVRVRLAIRELASAAASFVVQRGC